MTYIKNFKKFLKHEEKETTKIGANPTVEEQTDTQTDSTAQTSQTTQTAEPMPATVENDSTVIAARKAVADSIANRDKVIAAKQKELNDLKAAQDAVVNTNTANLNSALADAANKETGIGA
jgi:hypothetical protein